MRILSERLSLTLYLLLLLLLFFSASKANIIGDASCKLVDCGQGTCNGSADDKPPFFFECECNPGWTKFSTPGLVPVTLPACVVPNCSLNFDCGLLSPPPLVLPINLSDACAFTWCGKGTCVLDDGGSHRCNCDDGAFNLLNMTSMPCLPKPSSCYFGSDCNGAGLNPPPPSKQLPPTACNSTWCGNGTCVLADEGGHRCNCSDDAFNLFNMAGMPCSQECYLGSDCNRVGLPPPPSPPPHSTELASPPVARSNASSPMPVGSGSCKVRMRIGYLVLLVSLLLAIYNY